MFRQGDPATAFFIVAEGWVKLYRVTVAGEEAVIHVFAKGDSFAEAVAFTGHPYPASAETVSEARIVRIPADHVVKCIRAMPEIALAMIASTSGHLHHLVETVEQLKAHTGVQRVAEFLASLCVDRRRHLLDRAALRQDPDRGPARPQARNPCRAPSPSSSVSASRCTPRGGGEGRRAPARFRQRRPRLDPRAPARGALAIGLEPLGLRRTVSAKPTRSHLRAAPADTGDRLTSAKPGLPATCSTHPDPPGHDLFPGETLFNTV